MPHIASAAPPRREVVGAALGGVRRRVGRLEDRVRPIREPEARELSDLREQALPQPGGGEQRAALKAQRACRGRPSRRLNRDPAVWTQHRPERRYKFGAAGPRFAGEPRGRRVAAGELQLVSILPRLGTGLRRTREEAILVKRVAGGRPGARRLHTPTSSQRALCSPSAGATPVIRAEGFFSCRAPESRPVPRWF